jgi:hypothetical protein
VLVVLAPLGAATARPLPWFEFVPALDKYITASIDLTYAPGAAVATVPGGDAAVAYSCTSAVGTGFLSMTCHRDAGENYRFNCTIVDIDGVGLSVAGQGSTARAASHCSDSTGGVAASLNMAESLHTHVEHIRRTADELYCAVSFQELSAPLHTRCTFAATARVPIIGGITMSQEVGAPDYAVAAGGVLATDFDCWKTLPPLQSLQPPTVTCTKKQSANQWYCHQTIVSAIVTPLLPPAVPQVNGQLSCNGNIGPVPPTGSVAPPGTYTLSTVDVPTNNGTYDSSQTTMDHDTDTFICQARGPLDTIEPVPPWKVQCAEP